MTAPQIIEQNGRRAFAVVPYRDYLRLRQAYEDWRDLAILTAPRRISSAATAARSAISPRKRAG